MLVRRVLWVRAARKAFDGFPEPVQVDVDRALSVVAGGQVPENAKPLHGLGAGVMEIALRHRGDAWRVVYAVKIGDDVWVVHAFQKKSTSGIATPKHEIDLVRDRVRRLKEFR